MAADSGIDPRYAAQFQRGFDPAQHAVTPLPQRRGPTPVESIRPPVVQLVPPPPPIRERSVPAPSEPEPAAAEDVPVGVELRWQWALPLLAAVLLVAAALVFWTSATDTQMYTGNWTQEDYMLASARAGLPGPLFLAGILTLSVWLVARGLTRREPR